MSGLIIDSEACIGCGRCVRACASGGIVVEGERPNRCARVTDGCILCGGCVDACPVNAISIERDEAAGAADLDAYRDIWIFVQTDEHDAVASVAFELMGKGRELADARGCRLVALVGMSPEGSLGDLEHLICAGADEVLVCRDERLRQNDAEVYARLICDLEPSASPRPFCTARPPLVASWRPVWPCACRRALRPIARCFRWIRRRVCCSRRARRLAAT